jgi:hypothetical protein
MWASSLVLLLVLTVAARAVQGDGVRRGSDASRQLPADSVFRRLVLARRQAFGRGDSAAYGRLLAAEVVHINDVGARRTRESLLAHVAANSGAHVRYEVGALHARFAGAVVLVDCEVLEFISLGPREVRTTARELNIFVEQEGRWKLTAHAETPEAISPAPLRLPAAMLRDYVGEYEWWSGYRETYSQRGNQLFARATGDTVSVPLESSAPDAFFLPGDPTMILFARGASGRVGHLLVHFPDGRVVVAGRVR